MGRLTTKALDALGTQLRAVVKRRGKAPKYDDATARRILDEVDKAGLVPALEKWAESGCNYAVFSLDELYRLHDILCAATGEDPYPPPTYNERRAR